MLAVGGEAVGALLGLGGGFFLLRVFTRRETPDRSFPRALYLSKQKFETAVK